MRIFISKSERQWQVFEQRILQAGKSDLNSFMRSEIFKVKREYEECPEKFNCLLLGRKEGRRYRLGDDDAQFFYRLSQETGLSVSQILDALIIDEAIISYSSTLGNAT